MQDSDQGYPLKQPPRGPHAFDDFQDSETGGAPSIQPVESAGTRPAPLHQREEPDRPKLPRGRLRNTLSIALIAGILASLQTILVTLLNAGTYREAASPQFAANPSSLPISVATTIFGLFCLTSVVGLAIYFIAGFITGRIAVSRRMGFLCGFVAAVIAQAVGFIVQYFPGYPGTVNSGVNGGLVGIGTGAIVAIVILVIVALIGGLVGLLGAWLATRRHPYYLGYDA